MHVVCVCVCVCVARCMRTRECICASVGHPLELNNMGLEERDTGQAVSIEQVLGIGQAPRTHSFWQQVHVLFTHIILAGECNVSFFFCNYFII